MNEDKSQQVNISLSNVQNIRTVNIEGVGVFKVRKLGAGEELDLSRRMRRLMTILRTIQDIDLTTFDLKTPEGKEKAEKEEKRIGKLSDELNEIKQFELDTYKKCFTSDDKGLVDSLIDSLSDEERGELFKQIFGEIKPLQSPDDVEAKTADEVDTKDV